MAAMTASPSPADAAFYENPYGAYAEMHAAGPLFFWDAYDHWCAAGFELVDALLRDRRWGREVTHIVSREELGWPPIPERLKPFYDFEAGTMLEREPPVHTRLRRLVNRAFVSRQIDRLRPEIEAVSHRLIDAFEAKGEADLLSSFATPIPLTIITKMLGAPIEMGPQLLDWSHKMVAMYEFGRSRETEDAAVAATQEFSAYIEELIASRKGALGDDLLSVLIEAEEDGDRLTRQELVSTCIILLNAGHEATVHGIGNSVKTLLEQEVDVRTALIGDDAAAARTIEELLRFDPPLHMFTRYALEDMEVGGLRFKLGDKIGLLLGAANRDPNRFAEPNVFNPDRADAGHVSFGAGLHFCVGAPLARLE
ncbi:MAG: cytochrome P450, partial [Pseudomonadota bacterium]